MDTNLFLAQTNQMIYPEYKNQTARELYDAGYRQVSRRYGHVARVDITDEQMVKRFIKQNFGNKESGLPANHLEGQRDYYRRCISKDVIAHVPEAVLRELNRLVSGEVDTPFTLTV